MIVQMVKVNGSATIEAHVIHWINPEYKKVRFLAEEIAVEAHAKHANHNQKGTKHSRSVYFSSIHSHSKIQLNHALLINVKCVNNLSLY